MIERLLQTVLAQTIRHPRRMWLGLIVMTLLATSLLPRFSIEPDVSRLLPEDNEVIRLSRLIEAEVDSARKLMILVEADDVAKKLPSLGLNP